MATDLQGVSEVFKTRYEDEVNRYLKAGWKLLAVVLVDDSCNNNPSQSTRYVLGWIPPERLLGKYYEDDFGKPVHPEAPARSEESLI